MNREGLALRLQNACRAVIAAQDELTEIDSHFGDADHGITMTKIAEAVMGSAAAAEGGIRSMLEAGASKAAVCRRFHCTYITLERHLKRCAKRWEFAM